jgi:hypothetical protein
LLCFRSIRRCRELRTWRWIWDPKARRTFLGTPKQIAGFAGSTPARHPCIEQKLIQKHRQRPVRRPAQRRAASGERRAASGERRAAAAARGPPSAVDTPPRQPPAPAHRAGNWKQKQKHARGAGWRTGGKGACEPQAARARNRVCCGLFLVFSAYLQQPRR